MNWCTRVLCVLWDVLDQVLGENWKEEEVKEHDYSTDEEEFNTDEKDLNEAYSDRKRQTDEVLIRVLLSTLGPHVFLWSRKPVRVL